MPEVQKETYLNIILSEKYSEDSFIAKSVTLDFLNGFENPYTAMVRLNECLSEENNLAKMGLNCICGIVLALDDYMEFHQMAIIYKFINTLIDVIKYKIDDTTLPLYDHSMYTILDFIKNKLNINSIIPFFDLAIIFSYCEGINPAREKVFKKYCEVLDFACSDLMKKDYKLLRYRLMGEKEVISQQDINKESNLYKVNNILTDIYENDKKRLLIISNTEKEQNEIAISIQKNIKEIFIEIVEKEDIENIQINENMRILFLIDFESDDFIEFLYWFGTIEGKMEQGHLLGCFYNYNDIVDKNISCQKLVDRYARKDNIKDKLVTLLQ